MLVLIPLVLLILVALSAAYFGLVRLCAGASRDPTLRRRATKAAIFAWVAVIVVLWVGVPFSRDARGPVTLVVVPAVLILVPATLPWLPGRVRWAPVVVAALLFIGPVARVELLTLRHGGELRRFYDPSADESSLLFAVFEVSPERAKGLHVEGEPGSTAGYFVNFQAEAGGWTWRESQAWLWSDPGNMRSRCPYPVSALLLLHGVGAVDC